MQAIPTIGFDITKSVFQVHGIDAADNVIISKQLKRRYVLAFSSDWSRALLGSRPALLRNLQSKALPALVAAIVMVMERITAYAAKNLARNFARLGERSGELERADSELREPTVSLVLRR